MESDFKESYVLPGTNPGRSFIFTNAFGGGITIIPTLQMRKLRLGEVTFLAQYHRALAEISTLAGSL